MRSDIRFVVLAGAAALSGACRRPVPQTVAPDAVAAAAYEAVIAAMYPSGRPDTVLVADSSLTFEMPASDPSGRSTFASIPRDLLVQLARRSARKLPSSQLPLPPPIRIFGNAELRDIFKGEPIKRWEAFYRRYPRQRMWMGFSPIVFNADGTEALVYREYNCGELCAGGDLLLLARSANAPWRIIRTINYWIS